jgi:hypothetical protein
MYRRFITLLYSQSRFIDINFFKYHITYKIPLRDDNIKQIINIKIIDNEIVINVLR